MKTAEQKTVYPAGFRVVVPKAEGQRLVVDSLTGDVWLDKQVAEAPETVSPFDTSRPHTDGDVLRTGVV